jgi:hypothetical protein
LNKPGRGHGEADAEAEGVGVMGGIEGIGDDVVGGGCGTNSVTAPSSGARSKHERGQPPVTTIVCTYQR